MTNRNDKSEKKVVLVQGVRPDADTKSWYEYQWKERQQSPARLEDAAKFVSGTISICLAVLLAPGKSRIEEIGGNSAWLIIALSLLLVSLPVSCLVLFPWRYRFIGGSIDDFKRAHGLIIRVKRLLLTGSLFLFLLALSILASLLFQ